MICDMCGLPTEEPVISPDNRVLCEECILVCQKCEGSGAVEGRRCLNCSGSGKEPKYDPDADVFGGD